MRVLTYVTSDTLWALSVGAGVVSLVARTYLVLELRRNRKDLWTEYGSPWPLERDHLARRYPFRGWKHVFTVSGTSRRFALLAFAVSLPAFFGLFAVLLVLSLARAL